MYPPKNSPSFKCDSRIAFIALTGVSMRGKIVRSVVITTPTPNSLPAP